jgi:lysine/ornithine N-monooxygenase
MRKHKVVSIHSKTGNFQVVRLYFNTYFNWACMELVDLERTLSVRVP